jgi:hypothetical protein
LRWRRRTLVVWTPSLSTHIHTRSCSSRTRSSARRKPSASCTRRACATSRSRMRWLGRVRHRPPEVKAKRSTWTQRSAGRGMISARPHGQSTTESSVCLTTRAHARQRRRHRASRRRRTRGQKSACAPLLASATATLPPTRPSSG